LEERIVPKVTEIVETITIGFDGDGFGSGRSFSEISLALTGQVTVEERKYRWDGIRGGSEAKWLATMARWALGRQLNEAITRYEPSSVRAVQKDEEWTIVIAWRKEVAFGIIVTLSEFTDLDHAKAEAKAAIEELIRDLVPDDNEAYRRSLIAAARPGNGEWANRLLTNSKAYP
jgi:hypothetical protein